MLHKEIPLEGFCDGLAPNMEFVPITADGRIQIKVPTHQSAESSPVKIKVFEPRIVECPYKDDGGICKLRRGGEFVIKSCLWEDPFNNLKYLPRTVTLTEDSPR